jgi:aryl-alcohol dehydrogenase-like predicted oxidoreductase
LQRGVGGLLQTAAAILTGINIMQTRTIPSTGEPLPVIGCGTYVGFDRAPGTPAFAALPDVVSALFDAGGTVLDSSPMYGKAEAALGQVLADTGKRPRAFVATKVWTSGRSAGLRQMENSLRLLRTDTLDLMQVHNLVDWPTQLASVGEWKRAGRVRYAGITHYTSSAYAEVEAVLRSEQLDFLQINYSVEEREAAYRILPLAAERGVAVLVNRPFGGGGLMRRLRSKPLPAWAAEIGCTTWSQVLLKFVLSQPAVTCVIPGSGSPEHMAQNAQAGMGAIPEPGWWDDPSKAFA